MGVIIMFEIFNETNKEIKRNKQITRIYGICREENGFIQCFI